MAIGRAASFLIVILVIVLLLLVKRTGLGDLGRNAVAFGFQFFYQLLCDLLLLIIQVENGRTVLSANIGTLPVDLGRIMGFKEEPGQGLVVG